MDPLLTACLGALVGALGGWVASWVVRHRADPEPVLEADPVGELREVVAALESAAVVVGSADDVRATNESAVTEGVVIGDRVGIPGLLDLVRQVRRTGEPASVHLEVPRAGRPPRPLAARVLPLGDGLVFAVVDDRAPGLRVEEAARDFLANSTHELKTPIGAVMLLAEAVEQAADDPVAVRRFSSRIQAEASRLGQLVAQIIQLSRLRGELPRRPDVVDVDGLVRQALDRSRSFAEQRSITLTTGGASGLHVLGDTAQLVTALTNLVQNGVAYSDQRGRVVVTTRQADAGAVAIAVSDNGIGIAPDDLERVFERFFRVDYARSRETGGTGLGLSIVAEIAEGHHGTIDVWSKPGSGSTFTLTLPAAPSPAPTPPPAAASAAGTPNQEEHP
ncbi:HAMP domain-containing sensor histidine kinase [Propioniciclava soli]|uniref:Sensor-like histidine kinase SenX3 n=1 Tax=Propioniciclava soli TaxID=2775081 RepID=A0ABZ3CAA3_9ACTN